MLNLVRVLNLAYFFTVDPIPAAGAQSHIPVSSNYSIPRSSVDRIGSGIPADSDLDSSNERISLHVANSGLIQKAKGRFGNIILGSMTSEARIAIGELIITGYEPSIDFSVWITLSQQFAKQGEIDAILQLAQIYCKGLNGTEKDPIQAQEFFALAIPSSDRRALTALADAYQEGSCLVKDPEEAFKRYSAAAMAGEVKAMVRLSKCYRDGVGISRDLSLAEAWASRAAFRGNREGMALLALFLRPAVDPQRRKDGLNWLRKAARLGDIESMVAVGQHIVNSVDSANYHEAHDLFLAAAQSADDYRAWIGIAIMYERGLGIPADGKTAMSFAKRAHATQNPAGSLLFAGFLRTGLPGIAPNEPLSFEIYTSLAKAMKGGLEARLALGEMFLRGCGTVQNFAAAEDELKAVSAAGDERALVQLALLSLTDGSRPFTKRSTAKEILKMAEKAEDKNAARVIREFLSNKTTAIGAAMRCHAGEIGK